MSSSSVDDGSSSADGGVRYSASCDLSEQQDGDVLARRHANYVLARSYEVQEVDFEADTGVLTLEYVLSFRLADLERRMGLLGGVSSIARSVLGAEVADSVLSMTEVARVSTRSPSSVHVVGRGSVFGQAVLLDVMLERDRARATLEIGSQSSLLRAGLALASSLLQSSVQTALSRYVNDLRATSDDV